MANPAPILTAAGKVHAVVPRHVEAVQARPEERDEQGNLLRRAVEAREGYDTTDVTILTPDGGFVTIVYGDDAVKANDGLIPNRGDDVEWPVRPFVKWQRSGVRPYPVVGLSVAADVLTARKAAESAGRRVHVAS